MTLARNGAGLSQSGRKVRRRRTGVKGLAGGGGRGCTFSGAGEKGDRRPHVTRLIVSMCLSHFINKFSSFFILAPNTKAL